MSFSSLCTSVHGHTHSHIHMCTYYAVDKNICTKQRCSLNNIRTWACLQSQNMGVKEGLKIQGHSGLSVEILSQEKQNPSVFPHWKREQPWRYLSMPKEDWFPTCTDAQPPHLKQFDICVIHVFYIPSRLLTDSASSDALTALYL